MCALPQRAPLGYLTDGKVIGVIPQRLTWAEVADLDMPVFACDKQGSAIMTVLNIQSAIRPSESTKFTDFYIISVLNYMTGDVDVILSRADTHAMILVPDLGDALVALADQFRIEFIEGE